MRKGQGGGKPPTSTTKQKSEDSRLCELEEEIHKITGGMLPGNSDEFNSSKQRTTSDRIDALLRKTREASKNMDEGRTQKQKPVDQPKTTHSHLTPETSLTPKTTEDTQPAESSNRKNVNKQPMFSNVIPSGTNEYFSRYLIIDFKTERRKVNPYRIVGTIKAVTGKEPRSVTGNSRSSVTVCLEQPSQLPLVERIKEIDGVECTVRQHPTFNYSKGLIYIYDFSIPNLPEFQEQMKSNYNIADIQPANFIRTRSEDTSVFLVTFKQDTTPYSIYIPGERQDTRVFKFKNRALLCRKCQHYGHTAKWCKQQNETCRRCSTVGHNHTECTSNEEKCLHCEGGHPVGSRDS